MPQPQTLDNFYIEWVKLRVRVRALEQDVKALQKNLEVVLDRLDAAGKGRQ